MKILYQLQKLLILGEIMKKILIAISGKAKSGKNTVAELIAHHSGFDKNKISIVAIADPMKKILQLMFPEASPKCLYGPSEFRSEIIHSKYTDKYGKPLTHRQALLDIGARGRAYNDDIWLNILDNDVKKSDDILVYIVSDARFINELTFLKKAGFTMIRVQREDISKINDVSELEQDKVPNSFFNYIIDNNISFDELSSLIKDLVLELKK